MDEKTCIKCGSKFELGCDGMCVNCLTGVKKLRLAEDIKLYRHLKQINSSGGFR